MLSRALVVVIGLAWMGCSSTPADPPDGASSTGEEEEDTGDEGDEDPTTTTDPSTTAPDDTGSTGPQTTTDDPQTSSTGDSSSTSFGDGEYVRLETTLGNIVVELDPVAAPITVENFYAYVDAGFYDGSDGLGPTVFHRVAPGFVVQGGGITEEGTQKATMSPIMNESANGLSNLRMTIAMARTDVLDSATSQFYFNLVDNTFLDGPDGYAVFGAVVAGEEVIDAMAEVELNGKVPVDPIVITSATRL